MFRYFFLLSFLFLSHGAMHSPKTLVSIAKDHKTPLGVIDADIMISNIKEILSMPSAFGLNVRYAIKANALKGVLQIVTSAGLDLDASSLNEVKRARMAGISLDRIMLTSQEVYSGREKKKLKKYIAQGLKYNICSLNQLQDVADFSFENKIFFSMRVNPEIGSGESSSRNTGDKYKPFGVPLKDLETALRFAKEKGIAFDEVHTHIGSGGDPEKWKQNVEITLAIIKLFFLQKDLYQDIHILNLGGGFRVARMPNETAADVIYLGNYAKEKIEAFYQDTGKKLKMEIEPGTFIMANSGFLITKVMEVKDTGSVEYVITDGGMEVNPRPLLYGSKHPFYLISKEGVLLSSEFDKNRYPLRAHAGKCCESGDSQSLNETGDIILRKMAKPERGDYFVIGGWGAYSDELSSNYNSHLKIPIFLLHQGTWLKLRKRQTLKDLTKNEKELFPKF